LLCISVLYIPISQDMNIRAKSAKTNPVAVVGFLGGAMFYSAILIACIYMGITLARQGVKFDDPEATFTTFFQHSFSRWGVLPVLAGMAAVWSTLDTYLVNTITAVSQDVIRRSRFARDVPEKTLIFVSGLGVFFFAMLIALLFFKILALVLTALLIYISVLVPIACGRTFGIHDRIVLLVSLLTTAAIVACEWMNWSVSPKVIVYPAIGIGAMALAKVAFLRRRTP
jgi:hypothetical protein